MKVLMLSEEGDGLGVAQKMVEEGHEVLVWIKEPKFRFAGEGIVTRVPAWRPYLKEVDFAVCDMVGFGVHEDLFKRMRIPVFGCSAFMEQAELDRGKGAELMEKVGMALPDTQTYDSPEIALDLLSKWHPGGFVVKPHNNGPTAKTMIFTSPEHLSWGLTLYHGPVTIQAVVDGIEVSTEGWFNGRDWIQPFNHTFEEKRFMSSGGPNTGCMGNVVVTASKDRLVNDTVMRLTPILKKISYKGPVDVNTIVTKDTAFGLEFTSRLGYDAIEALMEGLQEPVTDLLFETAVGLKTEMRLGSDPMIAVRVSKAPWPHDEAPEGERGMPILGINEENLKHLALTDVFQDEDGAYHYAASDGVIAKATAHARTINEARQRVYRTVDELDFPGKQFRDDVGVRAIDDVATLKEWGWI